MKKKKNYDEKTKFQNKYVLKSKNTSATIVKSYDLSLWRGG